MTKYILAHDLGTSSDKASLFTTTGDFSGSITVNYSTFYSNGNWAEQDPEDWWNAFCESNKKLLKDIDASQVLGVIFSGHYPGCLPVDKNGKALYNAIIWQDLRAQKQALELSEKTPDSDFGWREKGIVSSICTLPKLMWLRENKPDIYKKMYKVLICPNDYIIHKLTGRFVVEHSNADSSAMYDRYNRVWSPLMLEAGSINPAILPDIQEITDIIGTVPEGMEDVCGLTSATKVICGTGDGPCGSLGAGCLDPGDAYISGGSSAWVQVTFQDDGSAAHPGLIPGTISVGNTMQAAGSSFSWMRNQLCAVEQYKADTEGRNVYDLINETIASSPAGAKGCMFLPHMMGERAPRWNPKAKGSFVGLSLDINRADMVRAVAEGIAFNLNVILREVRRYGEVKRLIMVGGLSKGKEVRQIFADILDVEIDMLDHMEEINSMGAAVFGGIALGVFKDYYAIRGFHKIIDEKKPNPANRRIYKKMEALYDEMYFAQCPLFDKWQL